ncbi:MAG: Ig-like domain-containing protein, partial [Eubacteriales bacterium]|nr:Ig-like domain-containing protein [Eubacteriales bacterium]
GTDGQNGNDQESEPQKPGMDGQSESGDESEPQEPGTGGQSESHQENVLQKPELPGASEQAGGKQSRDSYVRLNASRLQMQLNTGTKLLQIVECDTGDRVREWSSNHPKVVYVDPYTGELRALRTGKAKITLTMVSGARASCVVQVQRGVVKTTALSVPKMTIKLKVGESHLLSVVRTPLTANDKMTFTSSDKKIVSVNKNGKIKAKKKGTAKITIRTAGGRKLVVKIKVKK